jgi:hypothetical protein
MDKRTKEVIKRFYSKKIYHKILNFETNKISIFWSFQDKNQLSLSKLILKILNSQKNSLFKR